MAGRRALELPSFTNYVTLGKLLQLSVPWFPCLQKGRNADLARLLQGLKGQEG